jgi:hypothetical protein
VCVIDCAVVYAVVVKVCVLFSYSPVKTTHSSRLINFGVYYPDVTGIYLLLLLGPAILHIAIRPTARSVCRPRATRSAASVVNYIPT